MVALSVALSLLNVVPSFRLDGQYVIGAALESIGQAQWELLCVFTGTALIAGNVLFAFIILIVK
jgi:membrane-associated protease RseP (regulator of RpoE activity)